MGVPTAEKPPKGLNAYWLGVWRHALKTLKEQGTWAWEQRPLLDEYVYAMKAAQEARQGFDWLDALESYAKANASEMELPDWRALAQITSALPTMWDKHAKRAAALADQLALTPRGRKAIGMKREEGKDGEQDNDPFAGLDDEVARKRKAKAS
jgi:hypothetical protein